MLCAFQPVFYSHSKMALRADQLHEENTKLRSEIRKLQDALKSLTIDSSTSRDPPSPHRSPSWHLSPQKKEALIQDITDKVERGIFSPPKGPTKRGRTPKEAGRSRSGSRSNTGRSGGREEGLQQELAQELSDIEANLGTIQSAKPSLGPSLRKELENLRKSVGRIASKSPKGNKQGSFEAFMASEVTVDLPQQMETPKGKTLAKQIEALRMENERLRAQLTGKPTERGRSPGPRTPKSGSSHSRSATPRSRSPHSRSPHSRSPHSRSPMSKSPRSPHSRSPLRVRHCKICDYLLSKGFSTVYCSKHGSK